MTDLDLPRTPDWAHPAMDHFAKAGLLQRDAALADVAAHARGRLAYLATPYSKVAVSPRGDWCEMGSLMASFHAVRWARALAALGITAVSPVIQAVEMVHDGGRCQLDPLDAKFWEAWCRPLLAASGVVIVPPIEGWRESNGIWAEVRAALHSNRRVDLIRADEAA